MIAPGEFQQVVDTSPVDFAEVDLVHQAVAASDAQQGIGRLQCRQVVAGKAKPVRIFISHRDSRDQQFKARLLRAFPRATWTDQASENKLKKSQTYQVCLNIAEYLEVYYQGKAVPTSEIREAVSKVTATHKNHHRFELLCKKMFADAIRLFLQRNQEWKRQGHALIKHFDQLAFAREG